MEEVRVLVVDDSPLDRRVVELLLNNTACGGPFRVTAVDSGTKALELLRSSSAANEPAIDVVLTDYCMPEMTGYDLLRAIKSLSPAQAIPVIVMSSENEPQRISRCIRAGAEDFIVKPIQMRDVQRLRDCSSARRRPPSGGTAEKTRLEQDAHLTGSAMVLNTSSQQELSHYLQLLLKFVLLAYAILCLGELFNRCSDDIR